MAHDAPTIGVLSPLLAGAFFGGLLRGITKRAAAEQSRVVAIQTLDASLGDAFTDVPPFDAPVGRDEVAGYIAITHAVSVHYLEEARAEGKPVVVVSDHKAGFSCPFVMPDNTTGVIDAVEHLVAHGHERIAFATNHKDLWIADFRERYEAYAEALRRHGLSLDPDLFFSAPNCMEPDGEEIARQILAKGIPCTAVVASTDLIAAGIMRVLQAEGVPVPGRVAVVGFDDRDFAAQLSPSLSTVRLDFSRIGEKAAALVLDLARGQPVHEGVHRVRAPFIVRESCGCDSVAQASGHSARAQAAHRFRSRMEEALGGSQAPRDQARALQTALGHLGAVFEEAMTTKVVDHAVLREASEALFRAFPGAHNIAAVIEALQQYRRDLLWHNYSDEATKVGDECVRDVLVALVGARLRSLAQANHDLQVSLYNEYSVSMGLVGLQVGLAGLHSEAARPRSLDWLAGTKARRACLGLWDVPDHDASRLTVASYLGPGVPQSGTPVGTKLTARAFPPLRDLLPDGIRAGELVFVLPVKTATRNWGMLAVVAPAETTADTGRDIYFQWAALLGTALDHEALVSSLERQRQELTHAYRREQKLAAEVRTSEERYALAARAANDGLWDWDLASGAVFYSSRWKAMLGYGDNEVGAEIGEWLSRVHPQDQVCLEQHLAPMYTGEHPAFECEHRVEAKDGSYRWVLCHAIAIPGNGQPARRIVGSLTDITDRKELETRLRHLALHDALTGLPNRSLFMERLGQAVKKAQHEGPDRFCLLFLDLDGFKAVNDRFGHPIGDLLLTAVAQRITANLRGTDTAGRLGGDEFVVLLEDISGPLSIGAVVRRFVSELGKPYVVQGRRITVKAAIGVALGSAHYASADEMMRDADAAMYRAKAAGRGSHLTFAPSKQEPSADLARPGPPVPPRDATASVSRYSTGPPPTKQRCG